MSLQAPIDAAARTRALDLSQSFIVQAPAGSGKTGLLVRRILKLLTVVNQPEEILAITFTRKATAEMRERVIDSLQRAQQELAFEDFELDLKDYAEQVLARDQALEWNLLQQSQRLRIQTIDALCAELVRQMPWSTRFGAMPQIENDIRYLCEQAALRSLKKVDLSDSDLSRAISTLLIELGGDLPKLSRDLAALLLDRNRWLPLLFTEQGKLQDRAQLEQHWQQRCELHLKTCSDSLGPGLRDQIIRLGRYAANELPAKAENSPIAELKAATRFPQPQISALPMWLAVVELLLTKTGSLRKSVTATVGFAPKTPEKTEMLALLQSLADDPAIPEHLHQLRRLPEAHFHDGQWALLNALIAVLPDAASELYVLFAETGRCDFSELTHRAITALGDEQQPTDLALIQDYRTQHILMDEFQDTSPQQLNLLRRLSTGWTADDGRSLFLVGDPMQSIYRFREADVRVFLQVCEQGIGDIRPEFLQLSVNFRSAAPLIDWVNQVFPEVLPAHNDSSMGAVSYTRANAIHDDQAGQVHFHPLVDAERDDEAAAVLALIQAQLAESADTEIAVLGRSRTQLTPIAAALRKAGLAFESIDLESLNDQPLVQDLVALTRALMHPFDRIAWFSLLRAPWGGLKLGDLLVFSAPEQAIEQAITLPENLALCSDDAQSRLHRFNQQLAPILALRGKAALSILVKDAWTQLHGPACVDSSELAHAHTFFNLLNELEQTQEVLSLRVLEQHLVNQRVSSPEQPIKLLTMHKAKGLEFEQVILTGLDGKSAGRPTRSLLRWDAIDQHLLIAPIMPSGMSDNRHDAYLKQIEVERDAFEAGRLLYVAATRAKHQLHLFARLQTDKAGDYRTPLSGSLLRLIWAQTAADWQNATPEPLSITPPSQQSHALRRLPSDYQAPQAPATIQGPVATQTSGDIEFEWAREVARIVGTVTHHYLEHADNEALLRWRRDLDQGELQQRLRNAGLTDTDLEAAAERVQAMLSNLARDARAQWLFDPNHTAIEREWALSGVLGNTVRHLVLDRSFVDQQGTRWIIDFKTGSHSGGQVDAFLDEEVTRYREQLNRYAELLGALEPDRPIRCGLYFPALHGWREWSAP